MEITVVTRQGLSRLFQLENCFNSMGVVNPYYLLTFYLGCIRSVVCWQPSWRIGRRLLCPSPYQLSEKVISENKFLTSKISFVPIFYFTIYKLCYQSYKSLGKIRYMLEVSWYICKYISFFMLHFNYIFIGKELSSEQRMEFCLPPTPWLNKPYF